MTYKSFLTILIAFVLASPACAESPLESQLPVSVQIGALVTAPVIDGTIEDGEWLEYNLTRLDLDPDPENDSTTIHVFETIYAFNPDMYARLF